MKKEIRREALQNAYPPPEEGFARDTMRRLNALPEQNEEIFMKKKLSVGLVLAIILVIAALTAAVALSIPRAYFERVGKMQVESGYYEDWTLDEKLRMLALMEEYGVEVDEAALKTARDKSLTAQAREEALDAFMAEKYGIYGRIDVISLESILIVEKGDIIFWPVEEKAWYISFQQELGLLSSEEERLYTLPGKDDVTQQEAEEMARGFAKAQLGWTDEQLEGYTAYFACLQEYPDPIRLWEVTLIDEQDAGAYITFPAARGAVVEQAEILHRNPDTWREEMDAIVPPLIEKYGPMQTWGIEALHEYMPDYYQLPGEGDISPEAALEIALTEISAAYPVATREYLETLYAHTMLVSYGAVVVSAEGLEDAPPERTYMISFQNEKYHQLYNANINAQTGECWRTNDMTEFENK